MKKKLCIRSLAVATLIIASGQMAGASLTISGSLPSDVGFASKKAIILFPAVTSAAVLKIKLENSTAGSLVLCIGDFNDVFGDAMTCPTQLGDPVGPGGRGGTQLIMLVDMAQLLDRGLYVLNRGGATTTFTLTVE